MINEGMPRTGRGADIINLNERRARTSNNREQGVQTDIEVAENDLRSEMTGLESNIRGMNIEKVPEEKEDWYMGTLSDSYEEAQRRVGKGAFVGLGLAGGSLPAAIGVVILNGEGLTNISVQDLDRFMHVGTYAGLGLLALCGVAASLNFLKAKIAERRSFKSA